jgi:cellulose synthase (UDP-forming)
VYGNLDKWTAKGAAEQELVLQGPLQMGFYGTTSIPFIIGSHATYSMDAIKKIGGFQPTRAEDHLDTLYLASKGYKGVFVPDIIATGDGPETFDTYLSQQFAWAYSLMQVLTKHTPHAIWKLKPSVALQFLFTQTWYPVWALSMLFLFLTPAFSLLFNVHIAQTNFFDFVLHSAPISIMSFLSWAWSRKWHNPKTVFLSWRGIVLHIARWFIVVSAVIQLCSIFQSHT